MNKFQKLNKKIKENKNISKNFGIKYGYYNFIESIICRNSTKTKFDKKIHRTAYKKYKEYIIKKYRYFINQYKNIEENTNKIEKNCPIFIFWWQGEKNEPEIVKACIESVKKHNSNNEIIIITKDNFSNFITIPKYILDKFYNGIISIANFSDILRVSLLYKYGGIWFDATLYTNNKLSNEIFQHTFYTIKHKQFSDFHVCKGIWMDSFLASGKNNILMKYMKDFFEEYWKNENALLCYLLIDVFFAIGYERIEYIKKEMDKVPANNTKVFEIEQNLNSINYASILKNNNETYLFKTNYKHKYSTEINNKKTLYYQIINNKI